MKKLLFLSVAVCLILSACKKKDSIYTCTCTDPCGEVHKNAVTGRDSQEALDNCNKAQGDFSEMYCRIEE